jgi:hypothetical protein
LLFAYLFHIVSGLIFDDPSTCIQWEGRQTGSKFLSKIGGKGGEVTKTKNALRRVMPTEGADAVERRAE